MKTRGSRQRRDPALSPAASAAARGFDGAAPSQAGPGDPGHSFERLEAPAGFEAPGVSVLQEKARARQGENRTGLPDRLKSGLEHLSGMDLSGVRVHRNSAAPARVQALAYTQGPDIHVAPGEERHLPHEGWHAVQQMQGRVRPTLEAHGVSINDDRSLEREADAMGRKALRTRSE